MFFVFFKQKTAYEMRISDWSSDVCSSDLNYLYELPGFNVSIAAELDGAVVAGVVLDVVRNELFAATLGGGATRDGEPISTSDADQLAASLIATGFSYEADRRRAQAEVLVNVLPEVRDIRRFGAAAVEDRKSTRLNSSH